MPLTAQVSKSRRACDRILFGRGRGRAFRDAAAETPLWIAGAGGGSIQSGVVALLGLATALQMCRHPCGSPLQKERPARRGSPGRLRGRVCDRFMVAVCPFRRVLQADELLSTK